MVFLHQYDYLFAIGTIFAFGDAWGIGQYHSCPEFANPVLTASLQVPMMLPIRGQRLSRPDR